MNFSISGKNSQETCPVYNTSQENNFEQFEEKNSL